MAAGVLNANSAMGRLRAYKLVGACPYSLLDSKMEFSPIDDSARAMVLLLSSLVAYAQSPTEEEMVVNQPSIHFTMQVLYRLGFSWDYTSSQYVDMIFEMLRTLRYFN